MLVEIMKVKNEEVTVVTSLDIAETFGKRFTFSRGTCQS